MTVFSVILGVLLIIGGFSFLFTPLVTLMSVGYFIIILFFIAGIYNIARGISQKSYGIDFVFGILSVILGIVMLFIPGATSDTVASDVAIMNDFIILYVAAGWFLIKGILTIWGSIKAKKLGAGTSSIVCGVILGILEIGLTVYSMLHPAVLAIAVAWLLGFYFIEAGISMIAIASTVDRVKTNISEAAVGGAAVAGAAAMGAALNQAAKEAADQTDDQAYLSSKVLPKSTHRNRRRPQKIKRISGCIHGTRFLMSLLPISTLSLCPLRRHLATNPDILLNLLFTARFRMIQRK